ncbi:MAG: Phytanoyl-CoA dioxygenase [Polaromonas sp.]|nr:Phytanoyl-CoA dioxygenase [Polaromonas sp.]
MKKILSPGEIAQFHDQGFVCIPQITTAEEVAWLREAYDRLFERRAGWDKGDMFDFAGTDAPGVALAAPQLSFPSRYEPALENTIFRANASAMAKQLLGASAQLVFEHAMLKPARNGAPTPWHQDEAFYASKGGNDVLTFWMALQPVDAHNGCMDFIAGSNKGPLLAHRRINGDPRIHGLEALGVDEGRRVSCPLPAGGATVHGYHTLHHANANLSGEPRRAYALLFGIPQDKPLSGEAFPWNRDVATARLERAKKADGLLRRYARQLRTAAKAVIR